MTTQPSNSISDERKFRPKTLEEFVATPSAFGTYHSATLRVHVSPKYDTVIFQYYQTIGCRIWGRTGRGV